MSKIWRVMCVAALGLALSSCQPKQETKVSNEREVLGEYGATYYAALESNDPTVVESAIRMIDDRIASGDTSVASLHYNRAHLLYKLKRYDEAVATLRESKQQADAFNLATLLLRLGRADEANEVLRRMLGEQRSLLFSAQGSPEAKLGRVETIVWILYLLQEDVTAFRRDVLNRGVLSEQEMERVRFEVLSKTDELLQSEWPEQ